MVVYFGKLNLCSPHIYEVLEKKKDIFLILQELEASLRDDVIYEEERIEKNDLGEKEIVKVKYHFRIDTIKEGCVKGYIFKDDKLHYKTYNEKTRKFDWNEVKSDEASEFYFDIYNEMVGYVTAYRFGYSEFLRAFSGVINVMLINENKGYRFTVDQYCEGLKIEEINTELLNLTNIQTLKFKFQPPNGMDLDLKALEDNADNLLEEYKNANLATKTVTLSAMGPIGINIKSKAVQSLLQETTINGAVTTEESTKFGYASVEATDCYGNRFTTEDKRPVKREIDNMVDFCEACRKVIAKRKVGQRNDEQK